MDDKYVTYCPFCGSEMAWVSDGNSEDFGYASEGKIVRSFVCPECNTYAEFIEGGDEVED